MNYGLHLFGRHCFWMTLPCRNCWQLIWCMPVSFRCPNSTTENLMVGAVEIFATVWGAYNYEICKVIGPCICSFGWTIHSTYRVEDGCLREHIAGMDKPLLGLWNTRYNPGNDHISQWKRELIFPTGDTLVSQVILGGTKRGEGAVLERGATEVVLLGRQVKSQMES